MVASSRSLYNKLLQILSDPKHRTHFPRFGRKDWKKHVVLEKQTCWFDVLDIQTSTDMSHLGRIFVCFSQKPPWWRQLFILEAKEEKLWRKRARGIRKIEHLYWLLRCSHNASFAMLRGRKFRPRYIQNRTTFDHRTVERFFWSPQLAPADMFEIVEVLASLHGVSV